jgi:hypothetical protein
MGKCEVCGNQYDHVLRITVDGKEHVFDSFECAIHRLAPICAHCKCRVIGHGMQSGGSIFCCAHCAHAAGAKRVADNEAHTVPS